MRARSVVLVLALFSAACEGAPEQLTRPEAVPSPPLAYTTTCTTPVIASPKNNQLVYGSYVKLRWTVDSCRSPEDVEVYDNATGARVFADATPEWETYLVNGVFEYASLNVSGYQPGKYYKWRTRSKLLSDGVNPEVVGPWSGYGVFGIPLAAPSTSASVQSGNPSLSWSSVNGASGYKVSRMVDEVGYWDIWETVTGTSYTDPVTNVTGYLGTTQPSSGQWVAYRVSAVSSSGIESSTTSQHYYSYSGIIVH